MKKSFYDYSFNELENLLIENSLGTSAAQRLYNWHYKKKRNDQCDDSISKDTLKFLGKELHFELPVIDTVFEAEDRTVKFLFKLHDGCKVESVLIPFHNKYSLCLSSQVGCAMKCSFCYTGTQGLKRDLSTDEIVGQFLGAWRWLKENRPGEERILNIVFMGQGEPLHNFDAVKKACEIFLSNYGCSIGAQKITISTAGYIPGLKRWNDEMPRVNLALSLHSPFNTKRDQLIPINRKYPIEEVLEYVDNIPLSRKQFITYEYLLIANFNDGDEDAHKVGELLNGKEAYINLIPFNPFEGSTFKRPEHNVVEHFKEVLDSYKIPTLIRGTKGDDVLAACGQLNTAN
ncbi:MAG: 23S rRNA (adenine(2503)-C(2))-methyltransferase RlmN [Bacteriovoracaceae bacterium]|nr:23S rRNA (adenine(2503)-C(2))-methyltransferase RlmN [Bacteriovoracaceae bacterium]